MSESETALVPGTAPTARRAQPQAPLHRVSKVARAGPSARGV